MSTIHHRVSARQVAANQANAQKSTGPRTPAGKARAALNAVKHGAYARADNSRRHIMLRRGEDPAEYERLHPDLVNSWQPDDSMQAMLVKTLGDKTWEKLQLRQACLDAQLVGMELAQAQAHRAQLLARRWLRAAPLGVGRGLCGAKDHPEKFDRIFQYLDSLQGWAKNEICPDEYPEVMHSLYGEVPTVAGQRIGELFEQLFDDDETLCEKARQELPDRIEQEKRDVEQDRELYHRELRLGAQVRSYLVEDKVAAKEAALERQIAEQTRLLLSLKSKRSLWAEESEVEGESSGAGPASGTDPDVPAGNDAPESSLEGRAPLGPTGAAEQKNAQNGQRKPL